MPTTVLSRSASYLLDENGALLASAERDGSSHGGGGGGGDGAVGCMLAAGAVAMGSGGSTFGAACRDDEAEAVLVNRGMAGCLPCALAEAWRDDEVEAAAEANPA